MTQLKTLKDLQSRQEFDTAVTIEYINPQELRQVIIEWIKENRYQEAHDKQYSKDYNPDKYAFLESWIEYFFNILPEELKDEESRTLFQD